MRIQQIRNATLKITYGEQTILIDPWLQDKGTGFSAKTVKKEMCGVRNPMNELPLKPEEILFDVDFCLVTHIHPDHFSADYLPKELKIIVQNKKEKEAIEKIGFTNVTAFDEDELTIGSVTITKAPALHGDNMAVTKLMGPVSGFVLSGEDKTLYIAGDTVYFCGVERTLEKYKPDVIVLNCCEATLPIGRLIMNLADVEAVCMKVPKSLVIATHLDGVNHALITSEDVKDYADKKHLKQLCVPANGACIEA